MRPAIAGVAALLAFAGAPTGVRAEPPGRSLEYPVKAAFVYNLLRYVEWPPSADEVMVVGIAGEDPSAGVFEAALGGKKVGGRTVVVKPMAHAQEPCGCAVLFVPAAAMAEWPSLRRRLGADPVLTIGEQGGFADAGGVIGLVVEDNRVRFDANQGAAAAAGLRLSSRVLSLARSVRRAQD